MKIHIKIHDNFSLEIMQSISDTNYYVVDVQNNLIKEEHKQLTSTYLPLNQLMSMYQKPELVVDDDKPVLDAMCTSASQFNHQQIHHADVFLVMVFVKTIQAVHHHLYSNTLLKFIHKTTNKIDCCKIPIKDANHRLIFLFRKYFELRNYTITTDPKGENLIVSLEATLSV